MTDQKPRRPVTIMVDEAQYAFLVTPDRPAADQIREIIRPKASADNIRDCDNKSESS